MNTGDGRDRAMLVMGGGGLIPEPLGHGMAWLSERFVSEAERFFSCPAGPARPLLSHQRLAGVDFAQACAGHGALLSAEAFGARLARYRRDAGA